MTTLHDPVAMPRARRGPGVVALVTLLLAVTFVAAMCLGRTHYSPVDVINALFGHAADDKARMILQTLRLPRVLMAFAIGGALSVAGLLMQTLTRNPLATPSVLGITNGSHLGFVLAFVAAPGIGPVGSMAAAFAGAIVGATLIGIMGAASRSSFEGERMIIGGSLIGALFGSATVGIMFVSHMYGAIFSWVVGGLVRVDWSQIAFATPLLGAGLLIAAVIIERLEALALGESIATSLGVHTRAYCLAVMATVVLLAGTSTAVAGPIAYIGLIVPNLISRRWVAAPRLRLLACIMGGALLSGSADLLSRSISSSRTVPMSIWISALGASFFLAISMRTRPAGGQARSLS